jgi:hypothetical protein
MRILYVCFLLGLGWLCAGLVYAADEETDLGKIALTSRWNPMDGFQSALSFKGDFRREWLDSRISAVFRNPNDNEGYSRCDFELAFPNFADGFKSTISYQWNEDYRLCSSGFTYKFHPWKSSTLSCGYVAGRRDAVPGENNRYLYFSNRGNVGFDYRLADLKYQLDYTYTDKNYPITQRYSSGQQHIVQKVTWRPGKRFYLTLGYDEAIGDYPYDFSYSSSYWKAAWNLTGELRFTRDFRWNWEYYQMELDQSRERKRLNQQLKQRITWQLYPSSQLAGEIILREKIYDTEVIYDPDEVSSEPREDPRSRNERKISIQYHRKWRKVSLELGGYAAWLDYYTDEGRELLNTGLFGLITLNAEYWRLTVKISPITDLSGGSLPCYQLRIEYNP